MRLLTTVFACTETSAARATTTSAGAEESPSPSKSSAEPASRDRDRHLLGEAGRDHGALEVAQVEVEHLAARTPHHHQDADVGDRVAGPVLERGRQRVQRAALGEEAELLDDVVEVDQVLEPVTVAEVERLRLGRREGDRGGRHVAQQIHGQREVEVLPLGRRGRRDGDHAPLRVEDRSAAASRADRRRDLEIADTGDRAQPPDDAGRYSALEPLRASEDDDVLTGGGRVRVGEQHRRRRRERRLDRHQIVLSGEVQDLQRDAALTPPAHEHPVGAADDVGVGDEHAVARDEEAAAERERLVAIVERDQRDHRGQILAGDSRGDRLLLLRRGRRGRRS